MTKWTIARARQKFSELIREAAKSPQSVYRRDVVTAVLVDPESYQEYAAWREQTRRPSLGRTFANLRQLCSQERYEFIVPERLDRANAFGGGAAPR